MLHHPNLNVLHVARESTPELQSLWSYLHAMPHVRLTVLTEFSVDPCDFDVVISRQSDPAVPDSQRMQDYVAGGGGWLLIADTPQSPLPPCFGAETGPAGPSAEVRILFQDAAHPLSARLPDCHYVRGDFLPLIATDPDTETVLYADWHYAHKSVVCRRTVSRGQAICTSLQAFDHSGVQRILYRLLHTLLGNQNAGPLGVGILGYAPSVGKLHALGVNATPGLELRAICDVSPPRLTAARQDFGDLKVVEDSPTLAADPDVDLVLICTPPNSHASLGLDMLAAGKHVVCEKPLALTGDQAEALEAEADSRGLHLSCHQNRRWDPDYLAIRKAVAAGRIGELFYMETFVGGFSHPCGYWHSHTPVSGGTTYDWGAHYLDWTVSLMPGKPAAVICTRHKRVWHDVTNSDQERIQIRFDSGAEAEFMHSDIAAFRKPKWYLLGTGGALVGDWQDLTSVLPDPLYYFHAHEIPATEWPPKLRLFKRMDSGQPEPRQLVLPPRDPYAFYFNLADHMLLGEPLGPPLEDSIAVVKILAAAVRSAENGGRVEPIDG